jgi:serine phosphatase RsbU (regulator of sigma subunit)
VLQGLADSAGAFASDEPHRGAAWMSRARAIQWRRALWMGVSLAVVAAVFSVDRLNGGEVSLAPFYLLAVTIAAWKLGRSAGLVTAGLAGASWLGAFLLDRPYFSNSTILAWNLVVELSIFSIAALTISALRAGMNEERRLVARLEHAYHQLDREIAVVGAIQRRLLPARAPELPGLEIALDYATSERAGGDYYDFFPMSHGRLGVLIADASGHGTPAAVVMTMLKVLAHSRAASGADPAEFLTALDRGLSRHVMPGDFATACFVVLDRDLNTLEFALAGHNPPLLLREDGITRWLESSDGPPLGLGLKGHYSTVRTPLAAGDTLLLYTDGCVEAMNSKSDMFGDERLVEVMRGGARLEPAALRDHLLRALEAFRGDTPISDDRTFVLVRMSEVGLSARAGTGPRRD